jgi:hypothetical protein
MLKLVIQYLRFYIRSTVEDIGRSSHIEGGALSATLAGSSISFDVV